MTVMRAPRHNARSKFVDDVEGDTHFFRNETNTVYGDAKRQDARTQRARSHKRIQVSEERRGRRKRKRKYVSVASSFEHFKCENVSVHGAWASVGRSFISRHCHWWVRGFFCFLARLSSCSSRHRKKNQIKIQTAQNHRLEKLNCCTEMRFIVLCDAVPSCIGRIVSSVMAMMTLSRRWRRRHSVCTRDTRREPVERLDESKNELRNTKMHRTKANRLRLTSNMLNFGCMDIGHGGDGDSSFFFFSFLVDRWVEVDVWAAHTKNSYNSVSFA